jgi:hypothetical protein
MECLDMTMVTFLKDKNIKKWQKEISDYSSLSHNLLSVHIAKMLRLLTTVLNYAIKIIMPGSRCFSKKIYIYKPKTNFKSALLA